MSGSENPMPDLRAAASLTAGLLARRGGARPAMRRQPIVAMATPRPVHDDLGWNDMGDDMPLAAAVPIGSEGMEAALPPAPPPPISDLLKVLAERINSKPRAPSTPKAKRIVAPRAASGRKAAFTLRLDAERHLRLRLLSTVSGRSAQQLLVEALDRMVAENGQLEELVEQVRRGEPGPGGENQG